MMPQIGERIAYAVIAAVFGVLICFFFCLQMGTFVASAVAFIIVPATLAILGFLAGDKLLKVIGRITRWL